MKILIEKKEHIVVYIDYNKNNIPHSVKTICFVDTAEKPYWAMYDWDFFANNGDVTDIRAYNSGVGGDFKKIQAPKWADGYTGKFWTPKNAKLKGRVINGKKLKRPKYMPTHYMSDKKRSANPFKCAEITNDCNYCEMCGHESTDWCQEHKYDDENGIERWIHNNEPT